MAYNKKWYDENKLSVISQRRAKRHSTPTQMVECRLCNTMIGAKGMSIHLKTLHAVEFHVYVKANLDDFLQFGWQWCDVCGMELARNFVSSKKTYATCSRDCNKTMQSVTRKGKCSNEGYRWTDEQKLAHSRLMSLRSGILHTEETKKKLSISAKERATKPDYVNPMQGKTHTPEAIDKIMSKRGMTSLERTTAEILTQHGYEFTQQYFLSRDGRCHSYDFKLVGLPVLIEVDGDYWHGGPSLKKHFYKVDEVQATDAMKTEFAEAHGHTVVRMWESEINHTPSLLIERLKTVTT